MVDQPVDYTKIQHAPHHHNRRLQRHKGLAVIDADNALGPAIEIQRNRIVMTKLDLPAWNAKMMRTYYLAYRPDPSKGSLAHFKAGNEVPSALSKLSPEEEDDTSKRAIRIALEQFAEVPPLPKSFSLGFYKQLVEVYGMKHVYVHFFIDLRGNVSERLLALFAIRALASRQPPEHPWHVKFLWRTLGAECNCNLTSLIALHDVELVETDTTSNWGGAQLVSSVEDLKDLARQNETVRICVKCGVTLDTSLAGAIRDQLQSLRPSRDVVRLVEKLRIRAAHRDRSWVESNTDLVDRWKGQSEPQKFGDAVDFFVLDEGIKRSLQACNPDKPYKGAKEIYKVFPELAIVMTSLTRSRPRCLQSGR
mmetsp:Transcript_11553/g.35318  ORF Transcript_11553/g.35318 Transcript_11553/m.35318 type:complete len:364 (-) Transcript_11553:92-1183(-)